MRSVHRYQRPARLLIKTNVSRWFHASQPQQFHVSQPQQSAMILGGAALFSAAVIVPSAVNFYNAQMAARAEMKENEGSNKDSAEKGDSKEEKASKKEKSAPSSSSWGNSWFAKNFYDGGFEEKMSKREAALILGVRPSSSSDRVNEAYRRILRNNHPDLGGSPFLASKVNEAKEILLKGTSRD